MPTNMKGKKVCILTQLVKVKIPWRAPMTARSVTAVFLQLHPHSALQEGFSLSRGLKLLQSALRSDSETLQFSLIGLWVKHLICLERRAAAGVLGPADPWKAISAFHQNKSRRSTTRLLKTDRHGKLASSRFFSHVAQP